MNINVDVCIIGTYWHDVDHENISAQMLKETMRNYKYNEILIEECCKAIENHKWNMISKTTEGLIIYYKAFKRSLFDNDYVL